MPKKCKREPAQSYIAGLLLNTRKGLPLQEQVTNLRAMLMLVLFELDLIGEHIPDGDALERAVREAAHKHGMSPEGN